MGRKATGLQDILVPVVTGMGYEFVGLELLAQGCHTLLRVYIDSADGINVDDCGKVSQQLSGVLDVEDPIQGHYTLEVSSPGLDRPLFTAEHFERFAGSEVKIRLHAPVEGGRKRFTGILKGLRGEEVLVEADGMEYAFPLDSIDKANIIPQW